MPPRLFEVVFLRVALGAASCESAAGCGECAVLAMAVAGLGTTAILAGACASAWENGP